MAQYYYPPAVERAIQEIIDPKKETPYEDHVSRAITTITSMYFSPFNGFTITPEQKQSNRKKPDISVEQLIDNELCSHMFVEMKKRGGQSIEHAMKQLEEAIQTTLDEQQQDFCCFAIVVRGTRIGFFEFHGYFELLHEQGIENKYG